MVDDLMGLFERIWQGEPGAQQELGNLPRGAHLVEVAPDAAVVLARGLGVCSNVNVFRTNAGLVLVDTGNGRAARPNFEAIRGWDGSRLHTAVYTHGHGDHIFGVGPFDEEAEAKGWSLPRVIANEAVPARFDRYTETAGYNAVVNARQFGMPIFQRRAAFRYPDETYSGETALEVGGVQFELHHGRGETDDHTWVWLPARGILCTGDFFIWVFPNAGNPAKVQRYAKDWAVALRRMAALEPELLLPGHGAVIVGHERIHTALTETAAALEDLHARTIAMMNDGATLDEVIHAVHPSPEVLRRPFLRPVYDDPEFIVRNVWRLYGGWYDGNPANLKPARDVELALEVAELAGGAERLAQRARALAEAGELRLAGHLAQMAMLAAPDDPVVLATHAGVYDRRAAAESTLMARGIFGAAARASRERIETLEARAPEQDPEQGPPAPNNGGA